MSQALKVDQLEEEMVRLENQMEQRQLDWETREVEMETLEDEAAKARRGEGRIVKDMDSSKLTLPGKRSQSNGVFGNVKCEIACNNVITKKTCLLHNEK